MLHLTLKNVRLHSPRIREEKEIRFKLSCFFPHSPYSLDLAPSDFYLFSFPQNALNDKEFLKEDQVKMFVEKLVELEIG